MDEPEAVNEFMHDVEDKVVNGRKTAYQQLGQNSNSFMTGQENGVE